MHLSRVRRAAIFDEYSVLIPVMPLTGVPPLSQWPADSPYQDGSGFLGNPLQQNSRRIA
jgi:hypothetical protein